MQQKWTYGVLLVIAFCVVCVENIPDCTDNSKCKHGGFCIQQSGTCVCLIGFTGRNCEAIAGPPKIALPDSVTDCSQCQNGATCDQSKNTTCCICPSHCWGKFCENCYHSRFWLIIVILLAVLVVVVLTGVVCCICFNNNRKHHGNHYKYKYVEEPCRAKPAVIQSYPREPVIHPTYTVTTPCDPCPTPVYTVYNPTLVKPCDPEPCVRPVEPCVRPYVYYPPRQVEYCPKPVEVCTPPVEYCPPAVEYYPRQEPYCVDPCLPEPCSTVQEVAYQPVRYRPPCDKRYYY